MDQLELAATLHKSSGPTHCPQGDTDHAMSAHPNLADIINSRVGAPSHWTKE